MLYVIKTCVAHHITKMSYSLDRRSYAILPTDSRTLKPDTSIDDSTNRGLFNKTPFILIHSRAGEWYFDKSVDVDRCAAIICVKMAAPRYVRRGASLCDLCLGLILEWFTPSNTMDVINIWCSPHYWAARTLTTKQKSYCDIEIRVNGIRNCITLFGQRYIGNVTLEKLQFNQVNSFCHW